MTPSISLTRPAPPRIPSGSFIKFGRLCGRVLLQCSVFQSLLFGSELRAEQSEIPPLTKDEIRSFCEKMEPLWRGKIPPGQGRLFYFDNEWEKEIERIRSLGGTGAGYRRLLFDAADRIAAAPVLEYHPPEEMVTPSFTLLSALQEGWQRGVGNEIACLALAAKIDPRENYLSKLRELVLASCRYPTWGRQGKKGEQTDMDLAAGHVVRGIAMAFDWHRNIFSAEEKGFIRETVQKRVHRLYEGLCGGIYWSNWYTQNHNHICAAALGLAGLAFFEEIPEAPEWLAGACLNFQNVGRVLDPDGSSYEGLPYWGYGRSFILQFVEGTKKVAGTDGIYKEPAFRNAIAYRLGCSTPGFGGVLMWSDSRGFDAYGPQHILYRLASQYQDGKGQFLADRLPLVPQGGADNVAWTVLWYDPSVEPRIPTDCDYHAALWDVVTTRSGWGDGDYMLSLKSGRNRNHHTQLDAGSLSFNIGGQWLLLTPGYGLGVGKDGFFDMNGKRWEFQSGATESHSTLLVDGRNQRFDPDARGTVDRYISSPSLLWMETDLKEAYYHVQNARRRILHARGDYILVFDEITAKNPKTVEWLAQVPPDTKNAGRSLLAPGFRGSLSIQLVGEAGDFELRAPLSKNPDVSPSRLTTYASKNTGTEIRLSTLLQPVFGGQASLQPIRASREDFDTGSRLHLESGDWRDDVWMMRTSGNIPADGVRTKAEALFTRHTGKKNQLVAIAAVGATHIKCEPISLDSFRPFDLIIEKSGESSWILSMGSAFEGEFSVPETLHLFAEDGSHAGGLKPGRYLITRDSTTAAEVVKSLATLFPPRQAVPEWTTSVLSPLMPVPAEIKIRQECETSPLQKHGAAKVEAISNASGGAALTSFGTESPAHSVGWKIHVPQTGTYHLKLRYCTAQPRTSLVLLIDGSAPGQQSPVLPGPKGWGAEKYWTLSNSEWMEQILSDVAGHPLDIPLSEGDHEIRLAAPENGINLDAWELMGADDGKEP